MNLGTNTKLTQNIALVAVISTTISGKITDSLSGKALSKVIVSIGYGLNAIKDTTGDDGSYSLSGVASGTKTIAATLTGYTTKTTNVVVTSSSPITQNIELYPAISTTISGKVTDSISGKALAGVTISLTSGQGTRNFITNSSGTYNIDHVAGGTQTIKASLSKYISKSVTVKIISSSPDTQNIALSPIVKTSITGKITDSISGKIVSGVIVQIGTGVTSLKDTSGADGSYGFDSISSGPQVIYLSKVGYLPKTVNVDASGTGSNVLDIAINEIVITSLVGKVTDSISGAALKGAVVKLGSGINARRFTTGADGSYSFDSVYSGQSSLQVSLNGYFTKSVTVTVVGSKPFTANIALRPLVTAVNYEVTTKTDAPAMSVENGIIKLNKISLPGELKVFNLSGKLVYQQSTNSSVSIIQLPKNIYSSECIVKFTAGDKAYIGRITPIK